jgi:hypothetical protein
MPVKKNNFFTLVIYRFTNAVIAYIMRIGFVIFNAAVAEWACLVAVCHKKNPAD